MVLPIDYTYTIPTNAPLATHCFKSPCSLFDFVQCGWKFKRQVVTLIDGINAFPHNTIERCNRNTSKKFDIQVWTTSEVSQKCIKAHNSGRIAPPLRRPIWQSTSNLSRTMDSNRRKELSDIRRCRLKSGRTACFVQKASNCRRWLNMEGDRTPFFFFLWLSSNKKAVAVRLAIKDADLASWSAACLSHWPPMTTIRELSQHIPLLASCCRNTNQLSQATWDLCLVRTLLLMSLTLKISRQHELVDSASLRSHSDACQPKTPANPKIRFAGVLSWDDLHFFWNCADAAAVFAGFADLRKKTLDKTES